MKKLCLRTTLALLFILTASMSHLYSQQWEWGHKIEPLNDNSNVEVLAIDKYQDDFYLTGRFKGEVQYTNYLGQLTTSTSLGGYDVFVARCTNTGTITWFARGGSAGDDQANDIIVTYPGFLYIIITGYIGKNSLTTAADFKGAPPANSICYTDVYNNSNRKAFVACYSGVGAINWVTGLDQGSIDTESEGRGITKDPTSASRFFVAGYFKSDIAYGEVDRRAGSSISCSSPCTVPYYESSEPTNAYNTFVMQFEIGGCSIWFNKLHGDPNSNPADDWNMGEDIVAYTDANGDHLYLAGQFSGHLCQNTLNPNAIVGGNTGFYDILSPSFDLSSDPQAGYIVKLGYNDGNWSSYGGPCVSNPINGFVQWNGNNTSPVYNAQMLYCPDPGSPMGLIKGNVVIKSLALRPSLTGSDPLPVLVGEWNSNMTPDFYANHQGPPKQLTNSLGFDVFIAQYPGALLSCNWVNTIAGSGLDFVAGRQEFFGSVGCFRGADGACGVAYADDGSIFLTGSFQGQSWAYSQSIGAKDLVTPGGSNDYEAYVVKYNVLGNCIYAESLKGPCSYNEDFGTAVMHEVSGGNLGGYFAGYTDGTLSINKNDPSGEILLMQSTSNSRISYYGRHAPDECFSINITPVIAAPTGPTPEFYVDRPLFPGTSATVYYYLPAGMYNVAYRDPSTSNLHTCNNGLQPGWTIVPFPVATTGSGNIVVNNLAPGIQYEWLIQGHCASGRFGVINSNNSQLAKKENTGGITDPNFTGMTLQIYPNPAKNTATFQFSDPLQESLSIKIYGIGGKMVLSKNITPSNRLHYNIDVSELSSGIYGVKVISAVSSNIFSGTLIKE